MIDYGTFETAVQTLRIGMVGIDNFLHGEVELADADVFELVLQPYRAICRLGLGLGDTRHEPMDPNGADNLVLAAVHRLVAAILVTDHLLRCCSQRLIPALRGTRDSMGDLIEALCARSPAHFDRWEQELLSMVSGHDQQRG